VVPDPQRRNLFWAIERMELAAAKGKNVEEIKQYY